MLRASSFQGFLVNFIKSACKGTSLVAPVTILAASDCIFLLIVSAAVPDNISIFQYRSYEGKINSFKRIPIKTKLQLSHDIYSTLDFFLDIIDMLMPSTITGKKYTYTSTSTSE